MSDVALEAGHQTTEPAHSFAALARSTMGLIGVLDQPCPHCTGEAGERMREQNHAAWTEWYERESDAAARWALARPGSGLLWHDSEERKALLAESPGGLPDQGCVECDWTGVQVTDAGRELLAFLHRHGIKS